MTLTIYVKELLERLDDRYGKLSGREMAEKMFQLGVIDHTLCKVLAIREFVDEQVKQGEKKVDSMWIAAEHFCCTYEYIRKCVYYYTDVNFD